MSGEDLELHIGDLVAIADGSPLQGERGRVVELEGDAVIVEVRVRVAWWKDVQLLEAAEVGDGEAGEA